MKGLVARWFTGVVLALPALSATISVQPSNVTVVPAQDFSLDINGSGLTDFYAFQFNLSFTPGLLFATGVSEGSLLPSGGTTLFVPGAIDNTAGTLSFTADTLVSSVSGVNGSGTLATIQFHALTSGTVPITLSNLVLLDSNLSTMTATVTNGTVAVGSVPEPATWVLLTVCPVRSWRSGIASANLRRKPNKMGEINKPAC